MDASSFIASFIAALSCRSLPSRLFLCALQSSALFFSVLRKLQRRGPESAEKCDIHHNSGAIGLAPKRLICCSGIRQNSSVPTCTPNYAKQKGSSVTCSAGFMAMFTNNPSAKQVASKLDPP